MKQGDFSALAKSYVNRPGYSLEVLKLLSKHTGATTTPGFLVADVGAGTGKLTENLVEVGLSVRAVEPNDAMREEGMQYTKHLNVSWSKGSGEQTELATASTHWLLMGSSFHWVEREKGLAEFHRVLKPGGFFTALWNPRDIERSPLHLAIEASINAIVPELKRVSSGGGKYTQTLFADLVSTGHFKEPIFVEALHDVSMTPERYLGAWRSVNDIQAQAGPERFEKIMNTIAEHIAGLKEVVVPYKTRAWTVQRVD
jgi:ubiquinone/menaquinone biosynthesis C-methylase UbiE